MTIRSAASSIQAKRGSVSKPDLEQIQDPIWRLSNLYWITDKSGNVVLFQPTEIQLDLLQHLYLRNLILKARQLGFSTLIQLMILDQCIFVPNTHAGVIAQDRDSAGKIFDNKLKFAWDRVPAWIKSYVRNTSDNANELAFSNGSYVRVATSMRSDTLQLLHISEFGKICAKYPHHAKEIITGTLPALGPNAIAIIESTAEGREGKFFEMCEASKAVTNAAPTDFRLHFYSWFRNPEYVTEFDEEFSAEDLKYFADTELACNVTLTRQQRNWYKLTLRSVFSGDTHQMHQEYPSTPDEAFERDTEGCWYTTQLAKAYQDNRITDVPWDPRYPVDTWWDLGGDGTPVVYTQRIGPWTHVIDYQETFASPYTEDVKLMLEKPYQWGTHHLPHDGINKPKQAHANLSALQQLTGLGLRNIVTVPRIPRVIDGIQAMRSRFHELKIDKTKCAKLIMHLSRYRKTWSTALAEYTDEPVHDVHSHGSDALRQWAQTPPDTHVNVRAAQRCG